MEKVLKLDKNLTFPDVHNRSFRSNIKSYKLYNFIFKYFLRPLLSWGKAF